MYGLDVSADRVCFVQLINLADSKRDLTTHGVGVIGSLRLRNLTVDMLRFASKILPTL